MNLMPLLDRTGTTTAWADRQTGWVSDLEGKVFALVVFDGVFDRTGAQIGWWHGDYIQDRHGHVVLSRPSTKIENLSTPQPKKIPRPPNLHLPSAHPVLLWLLRLPRKKPLWGDFAGLIGAVGPTQTGAENHASN